jgi:hypothetical protein
LQHEPSIGGSRKRLDERDGQRQRPAGWRRLHLEQIGPHFDAVADRELRSGHLVAVDHDAPGLRLQSGFGFRDRDSRVLQRDSRVGQVDLALRAAADADRRTGHALLIALLQAAPVDRDEDDLDVHYGAAPLRYQK